MKMKLKIVFLLAGLAAVSFAGDLVTKSGVVFKNYVLMGADPKGIKIFYNNGEEDRQAVIPVAEFPDDMKEVVSRIAKKIPEARKAAQEKAKQDRLERAAAAKQNKDAAARRKKSADLLKKEQEENAKLQKKLQEKTPQVKDKTFGKK